MLDPDQLQENAQRAARGHQVIQYYIRKVPGTDKDDAMRDCIADLLHTCVTPEIAQYELLQARMHYEMEVTEGLGFNQETLP